MTKWGRGGLEPVGFALRKLIMSMDTSGLTIWERGSCDVPF
jgi:hypothetical protein